MKGNPDSDSVNISEKWFELVPNKDRHHLLNSLRSLVKLQPTTPSFKLYGKDDWSVVTDFLSSKEVQATQPPKWLLEYELSRESKFGGQGGHAPWEELRDNAKLYFTNPKPCHLKVRHDTMRKYERLSLLRLSARDALNILKYAGKVLTRANGWRLFSLKKTDEAAQRDALYLIRSGKWRLGWAYFFSRFNKRKKRLFLPMPFCTNILQATYAYNFLEAIKFDLRANLSKSEFVFWGDKIGFKPLFLEIMSPLIAPYPKDNLVYIVRDFEKMDTTVGVSQKTASYLPRIGAAYHIHPGSAGYQEMSEIMLFSNRCPVATPDGMWTGDHGEGSGSEVTNQGETCCNEDFKDRFEELLAAEASREHIEYDMIISVGNGDDGLSIAYLHDSAKFPLFKQCIERAAQQAAEEGGYNIQADKWDIMLGTYGKYCQYLPAWDAKLARIRMRYPAALILNSIVNPEKNYHPSDWDKDYRDCEIISKLNNGWDLEYFTELIDYVDNGMKYHLLGRDEAEFHRILSKWDKYLALQPGSREFNIAEYDWDKNPYSSPVVQYLLTKRGYSQPTKV